jgi:hypothetical protein
MTSDEAVTAHGGKALEVLAMARLLRQAPGPC